MRRLSLIYILFLFSCASDVDPFGPVTLEFDNRLEDHPGFTITYDITDIKLRRDDNLLYHDGQTRHVNAADEGSQEITLEKLTSGGYVEVEFVIKSINVQGSFEYHNDSATVVLTTPRTPVRAGHQPEVHLIFNIDKLNTSVQEAFVVDHIHEN